MQPINMEQYVILHNIRSAHNVGSIFRTADGAGVRKIYLVGYTPTPIDRFGREQPEIKKTSLGATETVEWEHHEDMEVLFEKLRKEEIDIVAVEQYKQAIDLNRFTPKKNIAYIFGNEVDGVPAEICERADHVLHIPMRGKKESLNVGVAVGIVLFGTEISS